jgi:hypothetical protein
MKLNFIWAFRAFAVAKSAPGCPLYLFFGFCHPERSRGTKAKKKDAAAIPNACATVDQVFKYNC